MTDRVVITVENGIADVKLNRPEKMNALDPAMFDGIIGAIDTLSAMKDLRAVVLSGEGKVFCAGLDLSNFAGGDDAPSDLIPRTHGLANKFQQVAWGWRELPVPVIAAVHGIAFGGGLQIMSGADIRFIHPDTRCSILEMRWGLVPDMGGYPLWRGNVRDDVMRKLVYTNEQFSGADAVNFGFATELADDPLAAAKALAEVIANKNPDAIRGAKVISNKLLDSTDAELLMLESVEQDKVIYQPNQIEAVAAEMGKRKPNFS